MAEQAKVAFEMVPIDDEALLAIGRIVRTCADLEDVLNLWICKLSGMSESSASVILGRTNISSKISAARGLAEMSSGKMLELHKAAFDTNIDALLECRNAVAHGTYVGQTGDGLWTFVTAKVLDYFVGAIAKRSNGYSTDTLNLIVEAAVLRVGAMDALLGLQEIRGKRKWAEAEVVT